MGTASCCGGCGSAEGPHATVTGETGGQTRHWLLCQACAGSSVAPAVVRRSVPQFCVRCDRVTDDPVVVDVVHQNSGPGYTLYACPACAERLPIARYAGGDR
ncbi:hypothetical protein ACX6XY_06360 [Streptomyces sp. O3]